MKAGFLNHQQYNFDPPENFTHVESFWTSPASSEPMRLQMQLEEWATWKQKKSSMQMGKTTLPETNSSECLKHLKIGKQLPKGNSSSNHPFSGANCWVETPTRRKMTGFGWFRIGESSSPQKRCQQKPIWIGEILSSAHTRNPKIRNFGILFSLEIKWLFPKIGVPQNGWWKSWKTLLKMDDLGGNTHHFRKHPY